MTATATPTHQSELATIAPVDGNPDIFVLKPKPQKLTPREWTLVIILAEQFANGKEPRSPRSLVLDLSDIVIEDSPEEVVQPLARLNQRFKNQQEQLVLVIPQTSNHRGECRVPIVSNKAERTHSRLDSLVPVVDTLEEAVARCDKSAGPKP